MTSQKLYGILRFIEEVERKLGLQPKLEAVTTALSNIVGQPAQPNFQSQLANALSDFEKTAGRLSELISPSQYSLIEAMGGKEFFDSSLAENVKRAIQMNAMTPSVARDTVQDLAHRRAQFLSTVQNARTSLEGLKINAPPVEPGSADLAFLIPREIFDNELGQFAKEISFISRLLRDFSEGITGQVEDAQLEDLSSSIPTLALAAKAAVIRAVAEIVNKFLEAWERVEKIRQMRAQMKEMGIKGAPLDVLEAEITTTIDQVIEESTEIVIVGYPGTPERSNELRNAIRQDTARLFGQIERGLTVEFRAEPMQDEEDEEKQQVLTNISDIARVIQFPKVKQEPMLLKSGEILEGDIQTFKHSKKTTTKSTTAKKGQKKDSEPSL